MFADGADVIISGRTNSSVGVALKDGATFARRDGNGYDLTCLSLAKYYEESNTMLIGTGVSLEQPEGVMAQLLPRSSISKLPISIANSPGLIDTSYRGEILIAVRAVERGFAFNSLIGKSIAQIIFVADLKIDTKIVMSLNETTRGSNGFGSTGDVV